MTVERYNMVNDFLNTLLEQESREFAEHLILQILPSLKSDDLCEIDLLLDYVSKATNCVKDKANDFDHAKLTRFKIIDDFIEATSDKDGIKESTAYMAPRLLGDSTEIADMQNVIKFLQKHVVRD